jgi:hypothetical protein
MINSRMSIKILCADGNKIDSMAPMLNPQYDVPMFFEDELDSLDY